MQDGRGGRDTGANSAEGTLRGRVMEYRDLSQNQRQLVDLMRWMGHGLIKKLQVRNREPVFDPFPDVLQEEKFDSKKRICRPDECRGVLKVQVVELLESLRTIGDGIVELIEVKNGLPFRKLTKITLWPLGPQTK